MTSPQIPHPTSQLRERSEQAPNLPMIPLTLNVSGRFAPDTGPSTRDRVPSTEFKDIVSIIRGKHSIQAGVQIYRNRVNELQDSLTEGNPAFSGIETGNPAADFMVGIAASFVQYSTLAARLRLDSPTRLCRFSVPA